MRPRAALSLAVLLLVSAGCASRADWIESTLVTVDVTGVWRGALEGTGAFSVELVLEQRGPKVEGRIRVHTQDYAEIHGTVEGDVLRFAQTHGSLKGEATVAGDEMSGELLSTHAGGRSKLFLRRSSAPSPTGREVR